MSQNWYKAKKSNQNKRVAITIKDGEELEWDYVEKNKNSYNVVSVKIASSTFNFYLWSDKTVKTAKNLYNVGDFEGSLKTLKKYSFDVNVVESD